MGHKRQNFILANLRYLTPVLLAPSVFSGGREAFQEDSSGQLCAEVPPSFVVSAEST